jgi:predicted HAD superfamily phosphohydrolase
MIPDSVEVIQSALEGIVPQDHIFGTELRYSPSGEIESLVRATAGFGKVARLEQLTEELGAPLDRVVYVGDGSSDIHVMLHVNRHDGFTIAVSESKHVSHIAKRTVISDNRMPTLVPILEDIADWSRPKIRQLFESYGFLVQGWESVQTDWLTLLPIGAVTESTTTAEAV